MKNKIAYRVTREDRRLAAEACFRVRERENISQEELASRLNVQQSHISNIEHAKPRAQTWLVRHFVKQSVAEAQA